MENRSGFDIDTTVRWVTGVLKDPNRTAAEYRQLRAPWRQTFMHITLPAYLAAGVAGFILSLIFGRPFLYGAMAGAPLWFLFSLAWSVAFVFVMAFIFDFFAGVFEGTRDYDAAFAALSLAMVPALAGGVVSPLPWLGWVISLAAGIYALVLAYRFIPLFLAVPEDKRIVHFVVSILVAFVVNLVGAGIIALLFAPDLADYAGSRDITSEPGRGVFGDLERQADFADQAGRDRYTPPSNGRLSEAQVAGYVRTLQRTAELRERLGAKFENTENDNPSIGAIFSGVKDAVRLGTAEMEVVKTAGGNWAEHLWVKNEIEVARVQRDSSPAVEHNYELFLEYQDEIEKYE